MRRLPEINEGENTAQNTMFARKLLKCPVISEHSYRVLKHPLLKSVKVYMTDLFFICLIEYSCYSRMKNRKNKFPVNFSRLPILYHRTREFDGWKSTFFSYFVLLQPNTTHHCTMIYSFAREIRENSDSVLTS